MNSKPTRTKYINRISYILNKQLHREDGPALIYNNGTMHWCKDGVHHRTDGPSVIYNNGEMEWYIDGKPLSYENFSKEIDTMSNKPIRKRTP